MGEGGGGGGDISATHHETCVANQIGHALIRSNHFREFIRELPPRKVPWVGTHSTEDI